MKSDEKVMKSYERQWKGNETNHDKQWQAMKKVMKSNDK